MKLKDRISWLMETVQQSLFPHLDESLPLSLTEPEKHLVKILELVQIEKHVPVGAFKFADQKKSCSTRCLVSSHCLRISCSKVQVTDCQRTRTCFSRRRLPES